MVPFDTPVQKTPSVNYIKLQVCDGHFLKSHSEVDMLKQQPVFYGISVKPSYKKHGVGSSGLPAGAPPQLQKSGLEIWAL